MAQTLRIAMVVMMILVTIECGNGMDTKDHSVCFKNCLEKCRIDDYTCQLKCEIECHLTPPALLSEKKEDQRVCFKNCLEKCRIDDYTCQLKCEIECHLTPPALPALLGEKKEDHRVCFKNCLEKCRIDDYTCQLKCEIECHLTPPSFPLDEAVMAPEQGKSDTCYRDCSNKWGLDSARMERCLNTCPTPATLF
ncbi:hypothetical protein HID58_004479 [Brassica napus]|uniref:Uncharacterized protein n=1 Tax=Brassica napus TaxID=3708 RepID=A0ABQ8E5W3_BRANA|nr:hypothetical protein HID58_004479 [Brassica napus]